MSEVKTKIDYKSSGVDIDKGDLFVERIGKMVKRTYNKKVVSGVGGFCSLYEQDQNNYLAASTDGVGTKLKLAIELNQHDTIGEDLVAMCANDLICCGASPQFFLDYFASAQLNLEVSEAVLSGIVEGCIKAEMALIGGETAEMPGVYQPGDYDLAGFSVGQVSKTKVIDGQKIKSGHTLLGLKSSGFHSNGYSLVRKLLNERAKDHFNPDQILELKKRALTPTRIYVKTIKNLLENHFDLIHGMANITGSGFLNIPRMNEKMNYHITQLMTLEPFMKSICDLSGLNIIELHKTFNMGVGFVVCTPEPAIIKKYLEEQGEEVIVLGYVDESSQSQSEVYFTQGKLI